ncbi:hypothetical protein GCM10027454_01690 [Algoriphagus aestuariicola]
MDGGGGLHSGSNPQKMEDDTMLKQLPMMSDIAYAALFLPSDLSAKITDVTINVTAGTTDGLNY